MRKESSSWVIRHVIEDAVCACVCVCECLRWEADYLKTLSNEGHW